MATCLIGLGSNLGDRRQALEQAVARLAQHPQIRLTGTSRWHETLPVGGPQSDYLNGAATLETSLGPQAVMALLQQVENELGRRRGERWGPRTIDLDLLLYDQRVLQAATLRLPHPRMAWRRFVLCPAAEVAGSMVHPTTGWTVSRLLNHLNTAHNYVAVAGAIGAGKTCLAERIAQRSPSVRLIAETLDLGRLETFYADPSGNAWQMELEFLRRRTELLRADDPRWSPPERVALSDFWFDQSLAFAGLWLSAGRYREFRAVWEDARRSVVRPKLIVLVDAPAGRLMERIRRRGRACERRLDEPLIERMRQAILAQAAKPDQGPILRLTDDDPNMTVDEVQAAMEAMR